ncbi:MAG: YebC/PmpR family DNA-binding transcriptional regulator [Candidatus Dasytiphilus stammeri]
MSGHSKWANTKHRKAIQDAKRSKIFTKIIRELVIAAKSGGIDPACNPRLRAVVDKALANNMNRETINRAILRDTFEDTNKLETMIYEGYGPGGTAFLVKCITDNRNRTISTIRNAFVKYGGILGAVGSVSYLFSEKGLISYPPGLNEDMMINMALEAGAEDIVLLNDGSIEIILAPSALTTVIDLLNKDGFKYENTKLIMFPKVKISIDHEFIAHKIMKLIDLLEDYDDVQEVYHNFEITSSYVVSSIN